MKRIISIKPILAVVSILLFAIVFKSCKKADNEGETINEDLKIAKENLIKQVKAQYGDISAATVIPISKEADEYFYKSASGDMVSLYNNTKVNAKGTIDGDCLYTCSNANNAADLVINYTLDYVQRFYICENLSAPPDKSTVEVKWTVSVPFGVLPQAAGQNTTGYLKIGPLKQINNTIYTAQFNSVTITNLGPAPGCATNTLYSIVYKFTSVPNNLFASPNQISASINLANNCSLVGNLVSSGYVSAPPFSQNAYLPCNRIDKVWASTSVPVIVNGMATAVCGSQPSGWQYIDNHQLEYRKVTSATSFKWEDQSYTPQNGIPFGSSTPSATFSPFNGVGLPAISANSGWWLIRYRNVKTPDCPTIPIADWGNPALWITEARQY